MALFEIKSWMDGKVLFSLECGSLKICVEAAIRKGVVLNYANLDGASLDGARLNGANLNGARLNGANLNRARLNGANLNGARLNGANLNRASLYGARLNGVNLNGASLDGANLNGASLDGARLNGASLYGARLNGANLNRASLDGANGSELAIAHTSILPDGDLIGWKKCRNNIIVKLKIPADAKRSHAFGRKCRAEFADVLEVIGGDKGESMERTGFFYEVGKRVTPDSFDPDFTKECSGGIHFYITRIEAENHS